MYLKSFKVTTTPLGFFFFNTCYYVNCKYQDIVLGKGNKNVGRKLCFSGMVVDFLFFCINEISTLIL